MVSSGQVRSDEETLSTYFTQYDNLIGELAGSWQGASYDNLKSQAEEFSSTYLSSVKGQMDAFISAIDAYTEYKQIKSNLNTAKSNLSVANSNNDNSAISTYNAQVSSYTDSLNSKKTEINNLLSQVTGVVLEGASSTSGSSGEFVNYYQYNYSEDYSQGTIATSGCGPTALAMVLTYLTGDEITPVETAALGNGTYTCSEGTYWSYFGDISAKYGVSCTQESVTKENIINDLSSGKTLIMSMGPGTFTKSGHFIVLRGIDSDGKIIVADPNSEERSNQTYDVSVFLNEGKQIWSY
jgi:hypothetical protein